MNIPITKHQSALVSKRLAALESARSVFQSAQQAMANAETVLLEVVASIAADAGYEELELERVSVEQRGDNHTLVLVSKLVDSGMKAEEIHAAPAATAADAVPSPIPPPKVVNLPHVVPSGKK